MRCRESGHFLLYTTVFFPLLLGGAALAFDIAAINLDSERTQSALDSLVLDSAHYLPNDREAKNNFAKKVGKLNENISSFEFSSSTLRSKVTATVTIGEKSLLLPMLLNLFGLPTKDQVRQISSEAELLPVDLALVLSDGVDEWPWSDTEIKSGWPKELGQGIASSALTSCILPPTQRYANREAPKVWYDSQDWITQSCFNPVFSAFKVSAMNISGATLEVGTNRAAVIFTPGTNGQGEIIRHIKKSSTDDERYSGYTDSAHPALASWIPYKDLSYELGDEVCIIASDVSTAAGGEYSLDHLTQRRSTQRSCLTPVHNAKCGQSFSVGESDRLDFECLSKASIGEAIYWRAAKRPTNNFTASPDIYAGMQLALGEVVTNSEDLHEDRMIRGNLASDPGRVIVVLTSVLPELDLSHSVIKSLKTSKATLLIGYLRRPNYPSEIIDIDAQAHRLAQWQSFIELQSPEGRFKDSLFVAESPVDLMNRITPEIISATRRVLVRK